MPDFQYGTSSFDRANGNFPSLPVINIVAEEVPTEPKVALISRPGLANSGITMGAGPVKGLYQNDGVLSNGLFGISAGHLYSSGTDLGAINGSGPVSLAGFETMLFANAGDDIYKWNGAALSVVTLPATFDVLKICVGTSRLILIDNNTGKFYWSNVLDPLIDALSFATAENSPDHLKDCLFYGDTLVLFGSETIEFWPASASNPDLPFSPLPGRTISIGIKNTGCATLFSGAFAWITNRNDIRAGDANNIVSTPSLEEKIAKSASVSLWTFMLESAEFLAVTLDNDTWVFSTKSSQWSQFRSNGQTNWIPRCYVNGKFGSSIDGRLVQWTTDYQDFGGVLERRFRAGIPLDNGTIRLDNVSLRVNQGQTPFLTGTYADPSVELRLSRDGGFKWGYWRRKSLGLQGQYRRLVKWLSMGMFGYPAVLMEIRVTDPVPFRVSNLTANEAYAGI